MKQKSKTLALDYAVTLHNNIKAPSSNRQVGWKLCSENVWKLQIKNITRYYWWNTQSVVLGICWELLFPSPNTNNCRLTLHKKPFLSY